MTSPDCNIDSKLKILGDKIKEDENNIYSEYVYSNCEINEQNNTIEVKQINRTYEFKTSKKVEKVGVLLIGLGGNNGTTLTGGIIANRENLEWNNKSGILKPNYYGSITQSSTTYLGVNNKTNKQIYIPLKTLIPMVNPNDLIIHGWDINNDNLYLAMKKAQVYDYNLQIKLKPFMENITPLPSIYYPDFIAANQYDRANHILKGQHSCLEHLNIIRSNIKEFKLKNNLNKVIIVWTANTERYSDVIKGVHDTENNIMNAIKNGHKEIAPSQMFAIASILEGCSYINGSPQNTFCPAIIAMAKKYNVYIAGDDFKSGQTKIKSVLVDFLVNSGIKPQSIVSYNHLGNNDGKNLSAPQQFKSKEISKSNVVDDMVCSNNILYNNYHNENKEHKEKEKPDHAVVIKYVPFVGDSKRAMDEYISSIFMNGMNTIVMHNTCEDSLLAAPIILDLIILCELFERIEWKIINSDKPNEIIEYINQNNNNKYYKMDSILTILSFLLKAPLVPNNSPLVNALFKQRSCIENILRACIGLPPINDMLLEYKTIYNPPLFNQLDNKLLLEKEFNHHHIEQDVEEEENAEEID